MLAVPKASRAGFHVFGLAAFAWSLPLFMALSGSEEFFIVYDAGRWRVVAFAVVAGIVVPGIVGLGVSALSGLHARMRVLVVSTGVALMVAFWLLPIANQLPLLPGMIAITFCVMIGAVVAHRYLRSKALGSFLSLLALVAPIYPLWFVFGSSLVFPSESADFEVAGADLSGPKPPVAVVIFDEMSLETLLDAHMGVNRKTFPNFARLADDATWFRNASTVADMTTDAVPAIMTGMYPGIGGDIAPTCSNHPLNLFTLFDAYGYDVFGSEHMTKLCPPALNRASTDAPSGWDEFRTFVSDIAIITGHLALKEDLTLYIPPIAGRVAKFSLIEERRAKADDADRAQGPDHDARRFRTFLKNINGDDGQLYGVHITRPHHPFRIMQSGKTMMTGLGRSSIHVSPYVKYTEAWPSDPSHATRDMQRYFHQARFVDRLLGEFLDRLIETGAYENTLIVVTADHGVSFRPGFGFRLPFMKGKTEIESVDNALDLIKVPVFIKLPGQTEGTVVDELFQSIDILPTIADLLNLGDTSRYDGRAMFAENPPTLTSQRTYSSENERMFEHDLDILTSDYDVSSKFELLDFERSFAIRGSLYERLSTAPSLEHVSSGPADFRVSLLNASDFEHVDPEATYVPAYIRARVESEPPPESGTPVLITINGKFGAVARAHLRYRQTWITAVVDEELFLPGKNKVDIYQIDDEAGELRFRRVVIDPQ